MGRELKVPDGNNVKIKSNRLGSAVDTVTYRCSDHNACENSNLHSKSVTHTTGFCPP